MRTLNGESRYGPCLSGVFIFLLAFYAGCAHQGQEEDKLKKSDENAAEVGNNNSGDSDLELAGSDENQAKKDVSATENASEAKTNPSAPAENAVVATESTGQNHEDLSKIMNELDDKTEKAPSPAPVVVESEGGGFYGGVAGTPMATGLPEAGALMVYVVLPKDTLSIISKKIYGDHAHWKELAKFSNIDNPNVIYPGDLIYYQLTEKTQTIAMKQHVPDEVTVVGSGEKTLKSVAKRVYGNTNYWRVIWRENGQIDNPNQVKAGEPVYYPAKSTLTASAQVQSIETYVMGTDHVRSLR